MADTVLVLGNNGEIVEQGPFESLKEGQGFISNSDLNNEIISQDANVAVDGDAESGPPSHEANETEPMQRPDMSVWRFYFDAMGWTRIILLCIFISIEAGFGAFRYVWLAWWSSSGDATATSRVGYWIGIYATFGMLETTGLALATFWTWVFIVPAASSKLHSLILTATMGASIPFLSSTETGPLVNRFSQDIRLVDMVLPRGFISTAFQFFGTVAEGAVAIAALPYLSPVIPFVVAVLVLIQRFYLRTSRQLRLLEIEMKAPVFTHFIESLHGLVTIRAFGWTTQYLEKTISLLDVAQRPYYLLLSVQRWLVLVLNLVVAGLVILIVGLGVALRDRVSPGLLGVALVMMTSLGQMMADLIQAWTLLETSLGAVSRIKSFSESTPQEVDGWGAASLGESWPILGAVEFISVFAKHDHLGDPVLRDVNLSILPGQTIGICGRTGR
jgi:ABC-type multidrug transport system fused ATPase/permease subunit